MGDFPNVIRWLIVGALDDRDSVTAVTATGVAGRRGTGRSGARARPLHPRWHPYPPQPFAFRGMAFPPLGFHLGKILNPSQVQEELFSSLEKVTKKQKPPLPLE